MSLERYIILTYQRTHFQGTANADGLALLIACLENYLQRGPDCPQVVLSTHFHELQRQPSIRDTTLACFMVWNHQLSNKAHKPEHGNH